MHACMPAAVHRRRAQVQCGHHPELEALFGVPGPFWSRQYYFWHAGAPLTLIHEVFSNSLGTWLGPLGGER